MKLDHGLQNLKNTLSYLTASQRILFFSEESYFSEKNMLFLIMNWLTGKIHFAFENNLSELEIVRWKSFEGQLGINIFGNHFEISLDIPKFFPDIEVFGNPSSIFEVYFTFVVVLDILFVILQSCTSFFLIPLPGDKMLMRFDFL